MQRVTPRVFHRIWLRVNDQDNIPDEFAGYWQQLRTVHGGRWRYRTWEDLDAVLEDDGWVRGDLLRHFGRSDDRALFAFRSDVLRYELLYRYGGVYIDTDVEPYRSFDDLRDGRPFVAWCSDAELDPAVMGGPAGHPALRALLDDLPAPEDFRPGWTPPGVTGPRHVTRVWRHRPDVRRLPPVTFFPVHWQEMNRITEPAPSDSYAKHVWHAGWKTPYQARTPPEPEDVRETYVSDMTPRSLDVAFIVAWRGGDEQRERVWRWVAQEQFQTGDTLVLGTDDGDDPFHKTLALNRAAAHPDAERSVLCITDADTWVPRDAIQEAYSVLSTGRYGWVQPWTTKWKLTEARTRKLLDEPFDGKVPVLGSHDLEPNGRSLMEGVPPLLVTREAFDAVNGMDERFRGWGNEDEAFHLALTTMGFRGKRLKYEALHLWHPRIGVAGGDRWPGQDVLGPNVPRLVAYRAARGNREAMAKLIAGNRS